MTSIFILTLKKLIKEQLSPLSISQKNKSESRIHNQELSLQQLTIIDRLQEDIIRIDSNNVPDKICTETIVELINQARKEVQPERESHKQLKDDGETIKCLTNLALHANDFYTKIDQLKVEHPTLYTFDLLNVPNKHNPLHTMYSMMLYYFGDEIFLPNSNINPKTRAKKEEKLAERIRALSERIKPEYNLEEQRKRALETLNDIANDNKKIIKGEETLLSSFTSKFTFYGIGVSMQATGKGRLGRQLKSAELTINSMKEDNFEPLSPKVSKPIPVIQAPSVQIINTPPSVQITREEPEEVASYTP